jgi:hypothetical protein
MANGIGALVAGSRDAVPPGDRLLSGEKKVPFPMPMGRVDVGEGNTSLSLEGTSFRSEFHIPVPQGYAAEPGVRPIIEVGWEPQAPLPGSPDGVVGFDVVGESELVGRDAFRGLAKECEVSFSHDDRRAGLWTCAGPVADSSL